LVIASGKTTSRRKENHLTALVTFVVASIHPALYAAKAGMYARS